MIHSPQSIVKTLSRGRVSRTARGAVSTKCCLRCCCRRSATLLETAVLPGEARRSGEAWRSATLLVRGAVEGGGALKNELESPDRRRRRRAKCHPLGAAGRTDGRTRWSAAAAARGAAGARCRRSGARCKARSATLLVQCWRSATLLVNGTGTTAPAKFGTRRKRRAASRSPDWARRRRQSDTWRSSRVSGA